MKKNGNDKLKNELKTIFWIFIIGSIFGCIVETIVEILVEKHFHIRKGLIYGPFIPVYGVGAIMYYYVVSNIKSIPKIFLAGMVLRRNSGICLLIYTGSGFWDNFLGL